MDANRFDRIARLFAARRLSRRAAIEGATAGLLVALGLRQGAGAQVSQAQCGNTSCRNNPGKCAAGCVCCVYGNNSSRCRPPGTCGAGTVACPAGQTFDPVRGCVSPPTCTQFILSGRVSPEFPLYVDDDFEIYLNGILIATDGDPGIDTVVNPIAFAGKTGDQLRIVAIDAGPECRTIDPLYLHCATTGSTQILDADGQNDDCDPNRAVPAVFYDQTFTITL